MQKYIMVQMSDGEATPAICQFQTANLPKYWGNSIGHTVVLWKDFDIDNPVDTAGVKIPKDAIKLLEDLDLGEPCANESYTLVKVEENPDNI